MSESETEIEKLTNLRCADCKIEQLADGLFHIVQCPKHMRELTQFGDLMPVNDIVRATQASIYAGYRSTKDKIDKELQVGAIGGHHVLPGRAEWERRQVNLSRKLGGTGIMFMVCQKCGEPARRTKRQVLCDTHWKERKLEQTRIRLRRFYERRRTAQQTAYPLLVEDEGLKTHDAE